MDSLAKYRNASASMWLEENKVGYLHLSTNLWSSDVGTGVSARVRRIFKRRVFDKEWIEWIVVWDEPGPDQQPYVDDVETDTASLLEELDADSFVLRGITYRLKWLTGEEKERSRKEAVG